MPTPPSAKVAGTAAFSKFMHVLQLVADAPEPMNIGALARASGYPRPTVHRIVAALVAERLLLEQEPHGTFALGLRLMQLASRSWNGSDLRLTAVEALQRLRDATGETVHLAVPDGTSMVYIDKLESPSAVRMTSRIGSSVSLHATAVGKAYLAALEPQAMKKLLQDVPLPRFTPNTIVSAVALRKEIDATRARGWAIDQEEIEAGIHCFGAAVIGTGGAPVAAVSVSTLVFRQKDDPTTAYVKPLLAACAAISRRIAETPSLSGVTQR